MLSTKATDDDEAAAAVAVAAAIATAVFQRHTVEDFHCNLLLLKTWLYCGTFRVVIVVSRLVQTVRKRGDNKHVNKETSKIRADS